MKENKIKQPEQIAILRSQIHFANYNPRKITDEARKKLKTNLKRVGLLGGIVWNRSTGNLVSGHQRISVMDDVNRYEAESHRNDYELKVEVVELDEKTEKEQNLFMNNRSAQGQYDDDMLREMISDIDLAFAGFDDFDAQMLGVGDAESICNENGVWREDDIVKEDESARDLSAKTKGGAENTKVDRSVGFYGDSAENQIVRHNEVQKIKDRIASQNDMDRDGGVLSYTVISFRTPTEKENFMSLFGYAPEDKYIDGRDFVERIEFGIE